MNNMETWRSRQLNHVSVDRSRPRELFLFISRMDHQSAILSWLISTKKELPTLVVEIKEPTQWPTQLDSQEQGSSVVHLILD